MHLGNVSKGLPDEEAEGDRPHALFVWIFLASVVLAMRLLEGHSDFVAYITLLCLTPPCRSTGKASARPSRGGQNSLER